MYYKKENATHLKLIFQIKILNNMVFRDFFLFFFSWIFNFNLYVFIQSRNSTSFDILISNIYYLGLTSVPLGYNIGVNTGSGNK